MKIVNGYNPLYLELNLDMHDFAFIVTTAKKQQQQKCSPTHLAFILLLLLILCTKFANQFE